MHGMTFRRYVQWRRVDVEYYYGFTYLNSYYFFSTYHNTRTIMTFDYGTGGHRHGRVKPCYMDRRDFFGLVHMYPKLVRGWTPPALYIRVRARWRWLLVQKCFERWTRLH